MATECLVPVSVGELWDKYSILLIKREKITDPTKLVHVEKEIECLMPLIEKYALDENIFMKLKICNQSLWDIEDNIRNKEYAKEFDSEFISLARSVYIKNDERAEIKREINKVLNSVLFEVKSYSNYM